MHTHTLPEETITVHLDSQGVCRAFAQGSAAVSREPGFFNLTGMIHIFAYAAMSFAVMTCHGVYERFPDARPMLLLAAVTMLVGLGAVIAQRVLLRHRLINRIVEDASWLRSEQTITIDDESVLIAADGYRFRYEWCVFTRLIENTDGLILGGGGQPIVVVPRTSDLSKERQEWMRRRIGQNGDADLMALPAVPSQVRPRRDLHATPRRLTMRYRLDGYCCTTPVSRFAPRLRRTAHRRALAGRQGPP